MDRPLLLSLVIVSCTFFGWTTGSTAQERSPPSQPLVDAAAISAPSATSYQEFLDYLRRMERRLDLLTKQNEDLARKNKTLEEQFHDLSWQVTNPSPQSGLTGDSVFSNLSGAPAANDDVSGTIGFENSEAVAGPELIGAPYESTGGSSDHISPDAAGGGSKASGGDPTTTGSAQEEGNRHVGKLSLKSLSDYLTSAGTGRAN